MLHIKNLKTIFVVIVPWYNICTFYVAKKYSTLGNNLYASCLLMNNLWYNINFKKICNTFFHQVWTRLFMGKYRHVCVTAQNMWLSMILFEWRKHFKTRDGFGKNPIWFSMKPFCPKTFLKTKWVFVKNPMV